MLKVKWPKVLDWEDIDKPILLNWINLGNGTMYRICAFFIRGGSLYPRQGLQISIEMAGAFFFNLSIDTLPFHGSYVSSKLNTPIPEGKILADWINAQLCFTKNQQGEYYEKYIIDNYPYNLIGENPQLPLVAEIIGE